MSGSKAEEFIDKKEPTDKGGPRNINNSEETLEHSEANLNQTEDIEYTKFDETQKIKATLNS